MYYKKTKFEDILFLITILASKDQEKEYKL